MDVRGTLKKLKRTLFLPENDDNPSLRAYSDLAKAKKINEQAIKITKNKRQTSKEIFVFAFLSLDLNTA